MAGLISAVIAGSPAQKAGICPGDSLLTIDGQKIGDLIDYNYQSYGQNLLLEVAKANGELCHITLDKAAGQDAGLVFNAEVFDGVRSCHNHCLFCFIDQLQPDPRDSLLLKDDDYRMSFLEGNFITGTNLREEDFLRIAKLRLSPLYISVHCSDPLLRGYLLGRPGPAPVLPLLKRLIEAGVELHTQIVLCPGLNDGEVLAQTIADLAKLHPWVASIAVVPVGLTRFQRRKELRLFSPAEAAALLDWLKPLQKSFLRLYDTRLVFAADEFYICAGRPFPKPGHYEEFSQLENGVGLAALFREEWRLYRRRLLRQGLPQKALPLGLITGESGAIALAPVLEDIAGAGGNIRALVVKNSFYGPTISVTGLLTGSCLAKALPKEGFERYIIPSHMLKHDSRLFLDGMTVDELSRLLKTTVTVAENNAAGLFKALSSI